MFCIYCRTDNPPEAHFCARCGQWQQKELGTQTMVCINCGESNPPDASFCRNCSAQLKREMSAPTSDGTLLSSRFSDPSMRGEEEQQVFIGYTPTVPGSLPMGNAPMVPGSLPMGNAPMVPGSLPMGNAPMVPGGAAVGNAPMVPGGAAVGNAPMGSGGAAVGNAPHIAPIPHMGSGSASMGNAPMGSGSASVGSAPHTAPISHIGHAASAPNYSGYPQPFSGTFPGNAAQTLPSQQPVYSLGNSGYYHSHLHQSSHMGHVIQTGKAIGVKSAGGLVTKWVVIIIVAIIVAAGSGTAVYVLTRPQPLIHVSSTYTVGKTPAGSIGTTLHFKGEHFSTNSSIIFLLDNISAPAAPLVTSDQNGNVSADLPITSDWSVGQHTLTARDASNYTSKAGVLIEVVSPGQDSTPGPFGAPADNASFKVNVSEQGQYDQGGGPFTFTETLIVTGHPDPAGGSVCGIGDTGQLQRQSSSTLNNGMPFSETRAFTCTGGTYKGGNFAYTETITSDVVVLNNNGTQITCTMQGPHIVERMSGSYTAQGNFSGSLTYPGTPSSDFACDTANFSFWRYGGSGTWTGTYTLS